MSSDYLNYSENLAFPPQQKTQAAAIKVFNCGEAAVTKSNREFTLEKKLAIAIEGINSAAAFLACMDDLSEISGTCNEQAALNELNKALDKIKESKV